MTQRLSVKEYAALKRVHIETVKRWIKRQLIQTERLGPHGHHRIVVNCCDMPPTQEVRTGSPS